MNKKQYFVLAMTEDGPKFHLLDGTTLVARINERYWGDLPFLDRAVFRNGYVDMMAMSPGLLILEGKVVIPKPREVVKTYSLE
jgi:hypothetical protein